VKKVSAREISRFIAGHYSIDLRQADDLWDTILTFIIGNLKAGRPVTLTKLVTIHPYIKQASSFRHPETGETLQISARRHVRFLISPIFKDMLRGSAAKKTATKPKKAKRTGSKRAKR
jgi:nucleoid DNA-binding protein